jgi:hypothetical protein
LKSKKYVREDQRRINTTGSANCVSPNRTNLERMIDQPGGEFRGQLPDGGAMPHFQSSRIARGAAVAGELADFQGGIEALAEENLELSESYGD